jgi:transposase-like protein
MDPHRQFCHNPACPASGQAGQGNIVIHSQREQRYRCTVCRTTFSARQGTPYYRGHVPEEVQTRVLTLIAYGCPVEAAARAFDLQPRTIRRWVAVAGAHAQAVHEQLVQQPRDLEHVQADEIRVRAQGQILWLALAIMVSTRLWLGGAVSAKRDRALIDRLVVQIRACAVVAPLLVAVDGLSSYVGALGRAFRERVPTGGRGAPRKVAWAELVIGQVVKQYAGRRVIEVAHWIAQGTAIAAVVLLQRTGSQVLNTAYIERLNGTFRERLAGLARRTRHLLRQQATLEAGMYLVGTVYNFCTVHRSLSRSGQEPRTPAMAAGLADHRWSVEELLKHPVPPPRWQPPKQRGRRSKEMQALIARWAA